MGQNCVNLVFRFYTFCEPRFVSRAATIEKAGITYFVFHLREKIRGCSIQPNLSARIESLDVYNRAPEKKNSSLYTALNTARLKGLNEDVLKFDALVCCRFDSTFFLFLYSFYQSLRRRNYVTPTSYLELIMTFKKLLDIKRQEIMTLKQRYVTGLEKLDFASSQVSVMQQELSDLQPELIKTSAETEKLMVKIEQDTVEVEAKKEVRVRPQEG